MTRTVLSIDPPSYSIKPPPSRSLVSNNIRRRLDFSSRFDISTIERDVRRPTTKSNAIAIYVDVAFDRRRGRHGDDFDDAILRFRYRSRLGEESEIDNAKGETT